MPQLRRRGAQVMRPLGVFPRLAELNKGVAAAVTAWLAAEKLRLKASGKVRCRSVRLVQGQGRDVSG